MDGRFLKTGGALIAVSVAALGAAPVRFSAPPPPDLTSFLQTSIGLDAKQSASIDGGDPVTKIVRTQIERDIVVFGIISVDVPRPWFVGHFKEVDTPQSPGRTTYGVFGTPALPSDVGQLSLSQDDIKQLKACRPRSCNFKLPASSMEFLGTHVDWSSPTVAADLAADARDQMAAYVNDYRQHGNAAMVVYDDNASVRSSEAFAELLNDSPPIFPNVPQFRRRLLNPSEPLDSVTSEIYWSEDQLPRTRPIVGIHELSIYTPGPPFGATIIAAKQLWADHYLEANVKLLTIVDRAAGAGRDGGVYLMLVREYRFDNLPNHRLFSIRNRVANGLRDAADSDLRRMKQSYEESFRALKSP